MTNVHRDRSVIYRIFSAYEPISSFSSTISSSKTRSRLLFQCRMKAVFSRCRGSRGAAH